MRYINTTNDNITFTDVDGRVVIVPKNRVYTHFKNDTITFLLVERYDKEGICLFTTLAEDLQINGVTYTYEQLLNGEGTGDMFSPTGLIIKLVDELPASGEQSTIYLIANDKGSFTEYLWLEETSKWEELGDVSKIDLSNYFTKSEINAMFANYYTQSEIDDMFDGYYTKTEVDDKLDLKANAADVYTKTEADNKFLTEHQSLDNYYTKDEVYNKTESDVKYATQTVVNEEIAARIQRDSEIEQTLVSKADKSDTYSKQEVDDALATKQDVGDYATNTALTDGLALKADKSDTYTKQEVDDAIANVDVSDQLVNYETIVNHNADKALLEASIALKANSADLATVATSGSYDDLSDKPTIPEGVVVDAELSDTSENPVQNKVVKGSIDAKQNAITDLEAIRSGAALGATAYQKPSTGIPASDIADGVIPTVPTNVSAFTNDAGYLTQHQDISNLATKAEVNAKQDELVSGTNIKTINGNSILGEGNIVIQGGGSEQQQADWNQTDSTAVDYIKNKPAIPDTSEFVTKAEYNPKEVAIAEALTDLNENKADKTEIPDVPDMTNYYTKSEIDAMIGNINTILASI